MDVIDIKGIDRADLLMALHAGTRSVGSGVLHDRGNLTREQALDILNGGRGQSTNPDLPKFIVDKLPQEIRFDYIAGRPIKVSFKGDELHYSRLYDRDAPGGDGSCQKIVDRVRENTWNITSSLFLPYRRRLI